MTIASIPKFQPTPNQSDEASWLCVSHVVRCSYKISDRLCSDTPQMDVGDFKCPFLHEVFSELPFLLCSSLASDHLWHLINKHLLSNHQVKTFFFLKFLF